MSDGDTQLIHPITSSIFFLKMPALSQTFSIEDFPDGAVLQTIWTVGGHLAQSCGVRRKVNKLHPLGTMNVKSRFRYFSLN